MKKYILTVLLMVLSIGSVWAQNSKHEKLFIPRNIKQAYENGTRAKDGAPGENYWQNHGEYDISLRVSPPDRTVKGHETITYHNNSPDTLHSLVYSLILNNHKPGAARQGTAGKKFLTSGVHIDKYVVNGQMQSWNSKHDGTYRRKKLSKPLNPGESIQLVIDWHYNLSRQSGREGAIDSTTFYLAYYYPRVAVYDDYNGWDMMTFNGDHEFYNDFNDYTVQVTVPGHFVVWATGTLQNPGQVLQPKYARRLKRSMQSDSVMHIATTKDWAEGNITADQAHNTWKWKANDITDVAMAISDHFNWDASSVEVDPATGRRASVQSAYADSASDYHHMVQYGKHALGWFSKHWPGVPYPFPKTTIVSGYADMEYPMMVNDRSTAGAGGFNLNVVNNLEIARFIAEHEISHTWFPFYMGINETRWGFMDEGWATTFEYLIGIHDLGKKRADELYKKFRVDRWIHNSSSNMQVPIITPGNSLLDPALGTNEYGKTSLGYLAVKDLLGDAEFKKSLQGYMKRWHGKHPMPWDFFYSFDDISGKDLNWFWKNWFFSRNYMDIAINDVRTGAKKMKLTVKNIGGFAIPFDVVAHYRDGSTHRFHESPKVWKVNPNRFTLTLKGQKTIQSLTLDTGIYVDADTTNNSWQSKQ